MSRREAERGKLAEVPETNDCSGYNGTTETEVAGACVNTPDRDHHRLTRRR